MSQAQILVLGAIAGLTIFLGLPAGRARGMSTRTSALLSAIATGICSFSSGTCSQPGSSPSRQR